MDLEVSSVRTPCADTSTTCAPRSNSARRLEGLFKIISVQECDYLTQPTEWSDTFQVFSITGPLMVDSSHNEFQCLDSRSSTEVSAWCAVDMKINNKRHELKVKILDGLCCYLYQPTACNDRLPYKVCKLAACSPQTHLITRLDILAALLASHLDVQVEIAY